MTNVTDIKMDVPCPECERRIPVRLRDIQNRRLVACPAGHRIQLKEEGRGIRDVDRAMRDLERKLKTLGGELKFKL
ncbi:MAG TPA: hypothetical protein VFA45_22655 [Actinomycetes bacterium]|jgi:DNA-directed RNA polymerase subunit RPC12/RpoP|nr:hypothetical protein [Actinomycetes bacterium]